MRSPSRPAFRPAPPTAPRAGGRRHRLSPLAQAVAMVGLLATPLWLQAQTGPRGAQRAGRQAILGSGSVAAAAYNRAPSGRRPCPPTASRFCRNTCCRSDG